MKICIAREKVTVRKWIKKRKKRHFASAGTKQLTTNGVSARDRLVGIQFRFRDKVSGGGSIPRDFMALDQVYINQDTGAITIVTLEEDVLNTQGGVFEVNGNTTGTVLLNGDQIIGEIKNYQKFHYFNENENTGLVFFTKTQVRILSDHFESVHLSGCQVNIGPNTTSDTPGEMYNTGLLFSLKLEGNMLSPNNSSGNTNNLPDGELPGFFIGAVCPPVWYITNQILGELPQSTLSKPNFVSRVYNQVRTNAPLVQAISGSGNR